MSRSGPSGKLHFLFNAGEEATSCKPAPAERAERLILRWRTIRSSHVPTPIGCSCGFPMAHVSVADFEMDLIDFIEARWGGTDAGCGAASLLEKGGRRLEGLLAALREAETGIDAHVLLDDIERAILSFASPRRPFTTARGPEPGD